MTQHKWFVRLVGAIAFTAACSSPTPKTDDMTVQGTVSQTLMASDVQAVGLGADGRSYWAALDAQGDFKLALPVGQSYRVILAKHGADGSPVSVAYLALTSAAGKTQWITAKSGTTLRLGSLIPASSLAALTPTGSVKPQSGSDGTMDSASDPSDAAGSGRGGSGSGSSAGSGRGGSADTGTDNSGSGRGGTASDGSGRGGSGSSSHSGSGRGGNGGDDDDDDAFDDDAHHADDPPCHQGGNDESRICPGAPTVEVASTRNADEDVSECGDFHRAGSDDAATCSPGVGAGAGSSGAGASSSGSSGIDTVVGSSGGVAGAAGGAGASSSGASASGGAAGTAPPPPAAPILPSGSPGIK